jgi:hypothetical protein
MDKWWVIPKELIDREEIDILDFLRKCGYVIGNIQIDTRNISYDGSIVGEIYEDACRVDISWPDKFNPDRIKRISDLITLLDLNEVPYTEKPDRRKILKKYEGQVENSLEIIRGL